VQTRRAVNGCNILPQGEAESISGKQKALSNQHSAFSPSRMVVVFRREAVTCQEIGVPNEIPVILSEAASSLAKKRRVE
jgi:hypothetical protein